MKTINNKIVISLAALLMMGSFSALSAKNSKQIKNDSEVVIEKPENEGGKPTKEWYVSTKVSVYDQANDKTYEGTNPAVLGRLVESIDGHDKNDIPTFSSVVNKKAAVVFVKSDWDEHTGEYHSDYHNTDGNKESWEMTVFSSVANGEVTLKWDGIYVLTPKTEGWGYDENKDLESSTLEDLHLIDTQTGEEIDVTYEGQLGSYTFTMGEEGSRTFIWALGRGNSYKTSADLKSYIKTKRNEERLKAQNAKKYGHEDFALPPL